VYRYLYKDGKRGTPTETVFINADGSGFTPEERTVIRRKFDGHYLRCIFIQESDIMGLDTVPNTGWRTIFYEVARISKHSSR